MEKNCQVEFRNISCSYFPESRVDVHYTVSSEHKWASSDWIGLFKVGWSSVKDYHTFVWALAPADYQEATEVNCCVHFQASYLPKPSSQEYEFVYIDAKGEVCSCSSNFTFCAPKPLEDLVTLEEESHGEEDGTDMLLVIPRAELLQSRLEECLRERAELLQIQEVTYRQREKEERDYKRAREAWDRGRRQLETDISLLQDELKQSQVKIKDLEREQQEETALRESLTQEKIALLEGREASEVLIRELEEDIKTLTHRTVEKETELESPNRRSVTNTCCPVGQAENEATLKEMRSLRERLNLSERAVDGLKSDLSAMVAQRDLGQARTSSGPLLSGLQVQLSETVRELQELKASLRLAQMEKEQLLHFSLQELMEHICQLEQKMGTGSTSRWSAAPAAST
ncbi:unnamed protein product, partial [Lampetra planeri]